MQTGVSSATWQELLTLLTLSSQISLFGASFRFERRIWMLVPRRGCSSLSLGLDMEHYELGFLVHVCVENACTRPRSVSGPCEIWSDTDPTSRVAVRSRLQQGLVDQLYKTTTCKGSSDLVCYSLPVLGRGRRRSRQDRELLT